MPSILRRRRSQHKVTQEAPLRPSLSLPDITSPLLDTGKWEWDEVPDLITSAHVTSPNITSTPNSTRNRAPSLIRDSHSPVQFHRPFTPWQIVGDSSHGSPSTVRGLGMGMGFGKDDFRDMNKWRASAASQKSAQTTVDTRRKARNRGRALESLNVVVAGGKGSGKTSLVKLLMHSFAETASSGHGKYGSKRRPSTGSQVSSSANTINLGSQRQGTTISSPTSPGPPMSASLPPIGELSLTSYTNEMSAGPTLRLSSHIVNALVDGYEPAKLRLIDTPGLNLSSDPVASRARERGVAGLLRLMEERFEETLKEESRIIRTRRKQEDGMIHLVLYLIDARAVLHPANHQAEDEDIDWSFQGLFDNDDPSQKPPPSGRTAPEPCLDISEMAIIRRLGTRANVLPVLTHSDSLTTTQLQTVRKVANRDLSKLFGADEGRDFGIIGTLMNDELETTPELSSGSESEERPLTPQSLEDQVSQSGSLPFTIFTPESGPSSSVQARAFPWGKADVMNPLHSDFTALQQLLVGQMTTALRSNTKEKLYETYRTERLLAKRERVPKECVTFSVSRDIRRGIRHTAE